MCIRDSVTTEQFGTGDELSAPDPLRDAQAACDGLAGAIKALSRIHI